MRTFSTGATRDSDDSKVDYEGFLSPLVLRRYGEYMNEHRVQANGEIRESDNWLKGIPKDAYIKSMWRHFVDVWSRHRGYEVSTGENLQEELCALLFNVMGYLHEEIKDNGARSGVDLPADHPLRHICLSREHAA